VFELRDLAAFYVTDYDQSQKVLVEKLTKELDAGDEWK